LLHLAAHHNVIPERLEAVRQVFPRAADIGSVAGRVVISRAVTHVEDITVDSNYALPPATTAGYRSVLGVPILREGSPIGAIIVARGHMAPFSNKQIKLLETFADQAVIAIENTRLFEDVQARTRELTETLDRQTATSEVLTVISRSPTNAQPVFEIIGKRAEKLCDAEISVVSILDGELILMVAVNGVTKEGVEAFRRVFPMRLSDETVTARAIRTASLVHVADVLADPTYQAKEAARASDYRGCLGVPMLREGHVIGAIFVARRRPDLFSDAQVNLLKTFADQAVIAIENARLFEAEQASKRELQESLDYQTATSDVLSVISRSPTDVQPVFNTIARSAAQLCKAQFCHVFRFDGHLIHFVASHGLSPTGAEAMRAKYPLPPGRASAAARSILTATVEEIPDVNADPDFEHGDVARLMNYRSRPDDQGWTPNRVNCIGEVASRALCRSADRSA
jgi:GAF domain-containing protein